MPAHEKLLENLGDTLNTRKNISNRFIETSWLYLPSYNYYMHACSNIYIDSSKNTMETEMPSAREAFLSFWSTGAGSNA